MLKTNFRITESDTGANLNMRPSRLLSLFQDAAGEDCSKNMNMGRGTLLEKYGGIWIVTRTSLYQDMPLTVGSYTLTTWHARHKGPVWIRGYTVCNAQGEIAVRASTQWTVLSEALPRHFVRIEDSPLPDVVPWELPVLYRFRMDSLTLTNQREISLSDLDLNRHCNNAQAANIIEDAAAYPVDGEKLPRLKELHIRYAGEARLGDRLDIMVGADDMYQYVTTMLAGTPIHEAALCWTE